MDKVYWTGFAPIKSVQTWLGGRLENEYFPCRKCKKLIEGGYRSASGSYCWDCFCSTGLAQKAGWRACICGESLNVKPCSGCVNSARTAWYCRRDCQIKDWNRHRADCRKNEN